MYMGIAFRRIYASDNLFMIARRGVQNKSKL